VLLLDILSTNEYVQMNNNNNSTNGNRKNKCKIKKKHETYTEKKLMWQFVMYVLFLFVYFYRRLFCENVVFFFQLKNIFLVMNIEMILPINTH